MDSYKERFKTIETRKLFKILADEENYEKEALDAARLEMSNRNISIVEEKNILTSIKKEEEKIRENGLKIDELKRTSSQTFDNIFNSLNPLYKDSNDIELLINRITISFFLLSLYPLLDFIDELMYVFNSNNIHYYAYILSHIALYIGIVFFYFRKAIGWYLLSFFLIFAFVRTLSFTILSFMHYPRTNSPNITYTDWAMPQIQHPLIYILGLGILLGYFYVLTKKNVLEKYLLERRYVIKVLGGITLFFLLLNFGKF